MENLFTGMPDAESEDGGSSDKIPQDAVAYRQGEGNSSCGGCANFLPPNECKTVAGVVSPAATCDLFTPSQETTLPTQTLPSDIFLP